MILNPAIAAQSQGAGGMITGEIAGLGKEKTHSITFQTLPKLIVFLSTSNLMGPTYAVTHFDVLHNWNSASAAISVSGNTVSWAPTTVNMPGFSAGVKSYYYAWL